VVTAFRYLEGEKPVHIPFEVASTETRKRVLALLGKWRERLKELKVTPVRK